MLLAVAAPEPSGTLALPVVAVLVVEGLRLGVTDVVALLPLAVETGVVGAAVPAEDGGVAGALAGGGCVPSASRRSAKGCESVCWPAALACERCICSADAALTSDMILGALDTAALPGDGNPLTGLQPAGQRRRAGESL